MKINDSVTSVDRGERWMYIQFVNKINIGHNNQFGI